MIEKNKIILINRLRSNTLKEIEEDISNLTQYDLDDYLSKKDLYLAESDSDIIKYLEPIFPLDHITYPIDYVDTDALRKDYNIPDYYDIISYTSSGRDGEGFTVEHYRNTGLNIFVSNEDIEKWKIKNNFDGSNAIDFYFHDKDHEYACSKNIRKQKNGYLVDTYVLDLWKDKLDSLRIPTKVFKEKYDKYENVDCRIFQPDVFLSLLKKQYIPLEERLKNKYPDWKENCLYPLDNYDIDFINSLNTSHPIFYNNEKEIFTYAT